MNNNDEFQKLDLTNVNQVNPQTQMNNGVVNNVPVQPQVVNQANMNIPNYQNNLNNVISSNDAKKLGMEKKINKNKALLIGLLVGLAIFLLIVFTVLSFVFKTIKYYPNHEADKLRVYIPTDFENTSEGKFESKSKACTVYGGVSILGMNDMKKNYEDNMFTTYGSTVEWSKKTINGEVWQYAYNTSHAYSKDYYMYLYEIDGKTYIVQYIRDKKIGDSECDSLEKHLEKSLKIKK